MKTFKTYSEEETIDLGRRIGEILREGDVLALTGQLGAGKTAFVKGLAIGLDVPKKYYVSSPTFTILKIYKGRFDLLHFDFYRLTEKDDFETVGFDDYLSSKNIIAIEWADKFRELLPKDALDINIEIPEAEKRVIKIDDNLSSRFG